MFELGDRLNVKLQNAKRDMEERIGNFSCVLRECGLIDASNRLLPADQLVREFRKFPLNGDDGDGWLREKLEEGIRLCHEVGTSTKKKKTPRTSVYRKSLINIIYRRKVDTLFIFYEAPSNSALLWTFMNLMVNHTSYCSVSQQIGKDFIFFQF